MGRKDHPVVAPLSYRVGIDELVASARVRPDQQEEAQQEVSTNGLPNSFEEQQQAIAQIAGG